ncbi:MAG: HEAT repeat domain-containing protein [Calothrix sp. MO_192.B10]|nr:HEAT repeat domain-containing protein [Calothrix sp. MO_192.B10]
MKSVTSIFPAQKSNSNGSKPFLSKQSIAKAAMPIFLGLLLLTTTACGGQDSRITKLESEKNVTELVSLLQKQDSLSAQAAEALGNIGDKQAVQPLITALSSEDKAIRENAATALGKIKDTRAVQPLLKALKDKVPKVRNAAQTALAEIAKTDSKVLQSLMPGLKQINLPLRGVFAKIGTPAVNPLINALKDSNPVMRLNAAAILGNIGDRKAIEPLKQNLTDWYSNKFVGQALTKLNWEPQSDEDTIHLLVAQKKGEELRQNWDKTKKVLLQDIQSKNYRQIQNGLYAFINIGDKDIVNELVKILDTKGNKTMALAYLNSREENLENAARKWAKQRGFRIVKAKKSQTVQPVKWGSW